MPNILQIGFAETAWVEFRFARIDSNFEFSDKIYVL